MLDVVFDIMSKIMENWVHVGVKVNQHYYKKSFSKLCKKGSVERRHSCGKVVSFLIRTVLWHTQLSQLSGF